MRQDTEVIGKFETREDTEAFRMGAGGGFDIREDTEVLRVGKNGTTGGVNAGVGNTEGFEVLSSPLCHLIIRSVGSS